ncbi:MAG: formylglycine-generating enzyme family protein [Oscillospiraceae bacterium]|nr:formylglycine-generating enzyme family protein [Oscillospiraceae bacterium]
MKWKLIPWLALIVVVFSACSQENLETPDGFILVKGGAFVNTNSNLYGTIVTVPDFYIGKYEVTQKEWVDVMGSNPSEFQGEDMPVETVSWYDAIEYCNKRSEKEGLKPYYNIDKDTIDPNNLSEDDDIRWTVTINEGANGYRLPTEVEWEYAASGGRKSRSYIFSGSDDPDEVAWHFRNSGDEYLEGFWHWPTIEGNNSRPQPVGQKKGNELGLYDMSGNVREWCWDWHGDNVDTGSGAERVWRGGGWIGQEEACKMNFRGSLEAHYKFPDQGFRVCRGDWQ